MSTPIERGAAPDPGCTRCQETAAECRCASLFGGVLYVHRCLIEHHWTAERYEDHCPTCKRPTFDVHARHTPHTDCTPCARVGL